MTNSIDNLQIKAGLPYHHVYNKMIDVNIPAAVTLADNKAYKTPNVKGEGKELRRECSRKGPTTLPKECSSCKKHYPTARSNAIPGMSV